MTAQIPANLARTAAATGELLRTHPSWMSYWRAWLAAACVCLLWYFQKWIFDGILRLLGIPYETSWLGLAVGFVPIIGAVLFHRYTHVFEIEGRQRLRSRVGFIARRIDEFSISPRVQASINQSVVGRLLDFGTIRFWTGDDRSELVWTGVRHPTRIAAFFNALKGTNIGPHVSETPLPTVGNHPQITRLEAEVARTPSPPPVPPQNVVEPTEELLGESGRVWVPLPTPHVNVCLLAFDNPDEMKPHEKYGKPNPGNFDHTYEHVFRIARWLKNTGDLVSKNEPIAIVDGSRARQNPLFTGLHLADPALYAPESGRLVWRNPQQYPRHLFGVIQSTEELIYRNVDVPFRSDFVPYVETLIRKLMGIGKARRLQLMLDSQSRDYLAPFEGIHMDRNLEAMLNKAYEMCHRKDDGPVIPLTDRLPPGWPRDLDTDGPDQKLEKERIRGQLRLQFNVPTEARHSSSIQYADIGALLDRLRTKDFDYEGAGLGFLVDIERSSYDGSVREVRVRT
ncbi:MAG: PH domain-containing protein [Gammaproteobacteria bacterium]|nr:PH domain-containing protein [Gammaproteobacteria bacterium]